MMYKKCEDLLCVTTRGADKSLTRPIYRCRRTEFIMPLERGVCSCAEMQVFPCYWGRNEVCQATLAISITRKRELSSSFFFLQGKAQKDIHAILTETLGEHAPSYPIVKTEWPSLNMVIFPHVMRLILDDTKQWPSRRLLIKFTS